MPRPSALAILVIGSTGAFGAAVTLELLGRGIHVRILARDLDKARRRFGNRANADYLVGDAFDDVVIAKALIGCQGVIQSLNLPADAQYRRAAEVLHLWKNVGKPTTVSEQDTASPDEAAQNRTTDSKTIPALFIPVCLGTDASSSTSALAAAAQTIGAKAVLLRTGRFYGATIRNPLTDSIFRTALDWRTIRTPGNLDARYPWTYAPDAARAAVDLLLLAADPASAAALSPVTMLDFVPSELSTQRQFLETIGAAAIRLTSPAGPDANPADSQHAPHVGTFSRLKLRLAALTNTNFKKLLAEQSFWTNPPALDGAQFARLLPGFVHTTPELAARTTLTSYR